ncbi:MAG TPA: hypothetical protein VK943_03625, partial [Arenibaculum sp.]|nr:hypothetical protein [Arenibaculum sp.]
ARPGLTAKVAREHMAVEAACTRLAPHAAVADLPFEAAFTEALTLLGLASTRAGIRADGGSRSTGMEVVPDEERRSGR